MGTACEVPDPPVHDQVYQGLWAWHDGCDDTSYMARYDDQRVPRGTSRRWEVILADEERHAQAPRLRAIDVRAQHRILQLLRDEDLRRIPLMTEGEPLSRYKQYLDLHDPARADFMAEGTEVVKPGQRLVARADVSAELWGALVGAAHEVVGWRRRRTA